MYVINKYAISGVQLSLKLPAGAEILAVQLQDDVPRVWILLNTEMPSVTRTLRAVATGEHLAASPGKYIATVQTHGGSLVWHVFDQGETP